MVVPGVLLVLVVATAVAGTATVVVRRDGERRRAAGNVGGPQVAFGNRLAFGPGRGAIIGILLSTAGLVGVFTLEHSLRHVLATPALYGADFDAGNFLDDAKDKRATGEQLMPDHDVEAVGLVGDSNCEPSDGDRMMRPNPIAATTMWVRSNIRRDWRALTLVTLSLAIAGGLAMTAGIGARRAGTAWKQFLVRTNMPDVANEVPTTGSGTALDDLRSRDGVMSVARMSFMMVGLEGAPPTGGFAGRDPGFGTEIYRPIVLVGRRADPTRADEVTINPRMAEVTGLHPGDHVVVVSTGDAVRQPATVTGITVGALDTGLNGGAPLMLLTPAFGATWFDTYFAALPPPIQGAYRDVLMARTTSDATSTQLIAEHYISGIEFAGNQVSAALDAEGTAYTVLAVVAALGTAIAMGQLIGRRVRRHNDQAPILAAIGLTPGGRRVALAGAHVCAVGLGMLLVPAVAYLASPLTDRGLLAQVDPKGYHVTDALVMIGGTIVGLMVLVGVAFAAAWRADPQVNSVSARTGARLVLPGPAGMFGARVATGWARRSGRTAARWHAAVLSVGVAAVTATLVWSGAARHVVATPAQYGATWDAAVVASDDGTSSDDPLPRLDAAQARLEAKPAIGLIVGRGVAGMLETTDDGRVEVLQIDQAAGPWWPRLLAGHRPQNSHEVTAGSGVLGARTHLGDAVIIDGQSFTIVGEHVVPQWSNGDFGVTVAMKGDALPPSDLESPAAVMWVNLAKNISVEQLATTVGEDVEVQAGADERPSNLTNLARIGGLDDLLLLACILFAFATLANGLVIATRARARDHRIMRALGADPSTVAGSVHWHTAIVLSISAAVGVPLGTIAGLTAWRRTAHAVFVGDALHRPGPVTLVVLAGLVIAGLLVAATTGASAARRSRLRANVE